MRRMPSKALRWERPARPRIASERWIGWARALSERYGWQAWYRRALAMTLVQPGRWICSVAQRWINVAWTLFPQIRLAIAPILREIVRTEFPTLRLGQPESPLPRYSSLLTFRTSPRNRRLDRRQAETGSEGNQVFPGDRVGPSGLMRVPLRKVFSRIHGEDGASSLRQGRLVQEPVRGLRRVVQERQRIEEKVHRAVMVQKHGVGFALDVERATSRLAPAVSSAAPVYPQGATAPRINIEQLTDQVIRQIDYRFTAYRERMGKTF